MQVRFLVPATCVGVRPGELYAPHRELFLKKAESYRSRWPWLREV